MHLFSNAQALIFVKFKIDLEYFSFDLKIFTDGFYVTETSTIIFQPRH